MKRNKILKIIFILLSIYIGLHFILYGLQEKLLFLEEKLHADYDFKFQQEFEEHFFDMENGERINAILFKTRDSLKGTILYFHGNAGSLKRWGRIAPTFTQRGYNILMIDYRGYGKSEGKPGEKAFYEDGQKAYDWIRQKVSSDNIILYGRSIGSGVACHIAVNNPAKMLILETPFNNIQDVVHTKYPFLYLGIPLRHQFPNDENLKKVDYPVHIFHGTKDRVVPYPCAAKLKHSLKATDQFYTIENGGHNNLSSDFPEFNQILDRILIKN